MPVQRTSLVSLKQQQQIRRPQWQVEKWLDLLKRFFNKHYVHVFQQRRQKLVHSKDQTYAVQCSKECVDLWGDQTNTKQVYVPNTGGPTPQVKTSLLTSSRWGRSFKDVLKTANIGQRRQVVWNRSKGGHLVCRTETTFTHQKRWSNTPYPFWVGTSAIYKALLMSLFSHSYLDWYDSHMTATNEPHVNYTTLKVCIVLPISCDSLQN